MNVKPDVIRLEDAIRPITIDELRSMEVGEWFWVQKPRTGWYCQKMHTNPDANYINVRTFDDSLLFHVAISQVLSFDTMDKDWVPYRQKPFAIVPNEDAKEGENTKGKPLQWDPAIMEPYLEFEDDNGTLQITYVFKDRPSFYAYSAPELDDDRSILYRRHDLDEGLYDDMVIPCEVEVDLAHLVPLD